MDVHTYRCCSRPGGHAVQRISRGTIITNTVVARILASLLDMIYKQHTQKQAAGQNNRQLSNSAVGMLLQYNKL